MKGRSKRRPYGGAALTPLFAGPKGPRFHRLPDRKSGDPPKVACKTKTGLS